VLAKRGGVHIRTFAIGHAINLDEQTSGATFLCRRLAGMRKAVERVEDVFED
jgi:hypothetical protein